MQRLSSLLAAGLVLLSVASYGQTPINSVPYTITSTGAYVLAKNLSYSSTSGPAIAINSADVTVDFGGHSLASTAASPRNIGVLASDARNVTIQNGTIMGFQYGVFLYNGTVNPGNSAGHIVESMRITHCGAIGIWLYSMTGCSIHDNYINAFGDSNPSNLGIRVYGASNQVIRNQVLNCNGPGILTQGGNYLESNFVSNCPIGLEMTFSDKYRYNTTIGCATPFIQGTPLTDNND